MAKWNDNNINAEIDGDDAEYGMSVSVQELSQLRQHVMTMSRLKASQLLEESEFGSSREDEAGLLLRDVDTNPKRMFRLAIFSNIFFLLGAILYVCVAHGDLQWAKSVQGIPVSVLQADDDATWVSYEQQAMQRSASGGRRRYRHLQSNTNGNRGQSIDINNSKWVDLPVNIQLALQVLGHNQASWDGQATSEIEKLPWSQLTDQQKNAARVIGYNASNWNLAEMDDQALYDDQNGNYDDQYAQTDHYDDQYQDTIAPTKGNTANGSPLQSTQAAVQVTTTTTQAPVQSTQVPVQTTQTPTTKTPAVQTNAPSAIEQKTIPSFDNVKSVQDLMVWDGFLWQDLPDDVKADFQTLGYNEERWNSGGVAFTEDLFWDELTEDQQKAAEALGYNQHFWDQAENGKYDIVTGQTDESLPNSGKITSASPKITTDIGTTDDGKRGNAAFAELGNEFSTHGRMGEYDDYGDNAVADQIMLFFAAASFLTVGVMNFFRQRQVFHIWMVQGGVFGILAASCMQASGFATLMLQTVSVHCFLIQALFLLRNRKAGRPLGGTHSLKCAGWAADTMFALGAVLNVITVYWQLANKEAYASVSLATTGVFSAWFWLFAAGLYAHNTIFMLHKKLEEQKGNQSRIVEGLHPNGEHYTIQPAKIQRRNDNVPQEQLSDVVIS